MPWHVHTEVGPDSTVHVWPDHDAVAHSTEGPTCLCGPSLEEQTNGNVLVTHHSLDGRELTEPDAAQRHT